jgi:penicillin-binding protein 2
MTLPFQNVTIKQDVVPYVQYYLAERQDEFQGVEAQRVYRRHYPYQKLAAQLFGTIGPINYTETKLRRFRGVNPNAVIGQSGLEWQYDSFLRGTPGQNKVQVNALGQFQGDLPGTNAIPGDTLKLSLDVGLQKVGETALAQSIATNPPATGGAFVALNPVTGAIYAMGRTRALTRPTSRIR